MCASVCVWMSEVGLKYLLQLLSALFIEEVSLTGA